MKRLFPILLLSIIFSPQIQGQIISGKIINVINEEPIEYVNIGIVDIPIGTTTDEKGNFNLDIKGHSIDNKVRISMIGYNSQTFIIKDLLKKESIIALEEQYYEISEVVVRPNGRIRKVGTTNFSRGKGVCGWGGTQFGAGHEIGTKIDLGEKPVKLKSIHVRLFTQSFDSTLLRLHIRNILEDFPSNEILKENIYLTISKKSGWVEFDISDYNIVLNGEIALTLEWLNVFRTNENRMVRMNRKSPHKIAVVLFNIRTKQELLYSRWGSEAKWTINKSQSPSFYLTVIE
jgi:hypothetical protein